jgi:hypothetical protein
MSKVSHAVEVLRKQIAEATDPSVLNVEEAIAVLEEIETDVQSMVEALREQIEGDEAEPEEGDDELDAI